MVRGLTVFVGLAISLVAARKASADPIGPDAFISPTLIDFEYALTAHSIAATSV